MLRVGELLRRRTLFQLPDELFRKYLHICTPAGRRRAVAKSPRYRRIAFCRRTMRKLHLSRELHRPRRNFSTFCDGAILLVPASIGSGRYVSSGLYFGFYEISGPSWRRSTEDERAAFHVTPGPGHTRNWAKCFIFFPDSSPSSPSTSLDRFVGSRHLRRS